PQVMANAFGVLMKGRRGAGHVEVPVNILQQEFELEDSILEARLSETYREAKGAKSVDSSSEPENISVEIRRAAQLLRDAKRPLIFGGGGVIAAGASSQLVEVAELLQAPVLMSPMGKGAIPADHPLCAGVTFSWVTADLQNMERSLSPLTRMADAALAVGFRFSQLATVNYTLPVPKSLVQIDIDAAEIGANYDVTVGILSDARLAL